ncbi:MAG: hypothetical protein LBL52_04070 [Rickettsiales bacterium]|jgi:hypothetical protein|nr:hypothetical protein [Rickettsiales bacterium]
MKKLVFVIALCLFPTALQAEPPATQPVSFGWELSPSYYSLKQTGVKNVGDLETVYLSEHVNTFGAFIGLDVKFYGMFRIFTSIETFEDYGGGGFMPYEGIYAFGAEFKWRNIVLGAAHDCTHPIISAAQGNGRNFTNSRQSISAQTSTFAGASSDDALYKEGANTRIYVRIRGGFGW